LMYYQANIKYLPPRLPLSIHLFQAHETPVSSHLLGWTAVLSDDQLKAIPIPGDHFSMLKAPNIAVLAQRLSEAILYR
jgi:arthrofactin-type cyclic lipopeptide synthetase C